jgi:phosphoribosylglycinamide formyltransferase-1
MRVGIIGSSGGSALKAAAEIYGAAVGPLDLVVLADRECGLERWGRQAGHFTGVRVYGSAETFSAWADLLFESRECADVLLFYTRRVAEPLINNRRVWNIHPALLPSFKGLHGVADARRAGVSLFGATLHHVDATLDTGAIDVQICSPMPTANRDRRSDRLSYIHKVWLMLLWLEGLAGRRTKVPFTFAWPTGVLLSSDSTSTTSLIQAFQEWISITERDL